MSIYFYKYIKYLSINRYILSIYLIATIFSTWNTYQVFYVLNENIKINALVSANVKYNNLFSISIFYYLQIFRILLLFNLICFYIAIYILYIFNIFNANIYLIDAIQDAQNSYSILNFIYSKFILSIYSIRTNWRWKLKLNIKFEYKINFSTYIFNIDYIYIKNISK